MATTKPITSYTVLYSSNTFPPRIWLKNGPEFIGQCLFLPNTTPTLPADNLVNGQAQLHYRVDNFQHVLDVLRNEKPVYLLYAGSGPGFENAIRTGDEPVGPGDIA
jgi:hypothetical protein